MIQTRQSDLTSLGDDPLYTDPFVILHRHLPSSQNQTKNSISQGIQTLTNSSHISHYDVKPRSTVETRTVVENLAVVALLGTVKSCAF